MALRRRLATPTVSTTPAYTANDVVGALLTFAGLGEGDLHSVMVSDAGNQATGYYLYLFHSVPTDITDNTVFDPVDADIPNFIHRVYLDVNDAYILNDNRVNIREYLPDARRHLRSGERSGNLYGFLVCVNTPTYVAATDISVSIEVGD